MVAAVSRRGRGDDAVTTWISGRRLHAPVDAEEASPRLALESPCQHAGG